MPSKLTKANSGRRTRNLQKESDSATTERQSQRRSGTGRVTIKKSFYNAVGAEILQLKCRYICIYQDIYIYTYFLHLTLECAVLLPLPLPQPQSQLLVGQFAQRIKFKFLDCLVEWQSKLGDWNIEFCRSLCDLRIIII